MFLRRALARIGVALVLIGGLLGACGDDDDTIEPAATSSTTTDAGEDAPTTEQSTTPGEQAREPVAEGSGCTPGPGPLPDGRWYGLVEDATATELSFDLACWFSGEDAELAAAEDGDEASNDYHVRNDDPTPRAVPVAPESSVIWYPSGAPDDDQTAPYGGWLAQRETRDHQLAVWIDVEDGTVTAIEEQWVP